MVPTLLFFVYYTMKRRNLWRRLNKTLLIASSINGLRLYLYFLGYSLTSIGNAVTMLYTWPLFATLFSAIYLRERLTYKKLLIIGIAFVGIVLMFSNKSFHFKSNDVKGMLASLVAAALYATTVPLFKKQLQKSPVGETVFYQNVVGAFLFLPFLFINPIPSLQQSSVLSFYAVLIGAIGFYLFFSGLKRLKASTASFLAYTEIISSFIFGVVFFQDPITVPTIIGAVTITVSSFLIRFTE